MKKFFIIVGILFIAFLGMHFYNKWYYKQLYKKPQMYVYDTFMGPANSVQMIIDIKYKSELYLYYEYVRKNKKYTSFSFPLKGLPQTEPVYVLGYAEDSTVAEIVSLFYRGRNFGGGYT